MRGASVPGYPSPRVRGSGKWKKDRKKEADKGGRVRQGNEKSKRFWRLMRHKLAEQRAEPGALSCDVSDISVPRFTF